MTRAVEVLVVGAGPTGLLMASELCRHGVACRILDKNPGPSGQSRATTIQPRSLELLDSLELSEAFVAAGLTCHHIGTYTADMRVIRHVSTDELDSPFPFLLSLPQSETERLLTQHLATFGTAVEWGVELRSFIQDDGGVTGVLCHADGREETTRVSYLIGCDGAHSTVRHTLGVPFAGKDYPIEFMAADVRLDWQAAIPANQFCFFVASDAQMFYGPFADGRCFISGDIGMGSGEGRRAADEPSLADLQELVDRCTPGGVVRDPGWRAYFRVHLRQAERYQVRRVFLAGDAAHVQSPAGGQGMNTGLQDAFNLGWKLGLVMQGRAHATILDSYHTERHRAGKDMLVLNEYLYHTEMESHLDLPLPQALRQRLALVLAGQEVIQQRMKRAIAELNINYRHSPIVAQHRSRAPSASGRSVHGWQDFGAAPHAGDRATDAKVVRHPTGDPLRFSRLRRGTKHHLVLFAGPGASHATLNYLRALADTTIRTHGQMIDTHLVLPQGAPAPVQGVGTLLIDPRGELHHRYGTGIESLYLIRPDGYVGFRSQPADGQALQAFLARIFV